MRAGAAQDLEIWLNTDPKQAPVPSPSQANDSASTISLSTLQSTTHSTHQTLAEAESQPQSIEQIYDPRPQVYEKQATITECDPESQWLLVCTDAKEHSTSLSQLDMCATSTDRGLFDELKRAYLKLKGRWKSRFHLKTVQSIRFVQVQYPIHASASGFC